jgi:hypothetical protein
MPVTITCRHCDTTITADDEDGLIRAVQDHTATHPATPTPSADHIRRRLRRHQHDGRGPDASDRT